MLKRSFMEIGSQISAPASQKRLQEVSLLVPFFFFCTFLIIIIKLQTQLGLFDKELANVECACSQVEQETYFDCYLAHKYVNVIFFVL